MEEQIISAVRAMREAQKEYFRTRDINVLRRSKALEKRVDTLLAEYENPQKGLFDNNTAKPILDACCGGKMFYFDKHDHRVLFQDIREIETTLCDGRHFEVKPDIKANFTNMPHPDNTFAMVVFDPPHLKFTGSQNEAKGWQMTKYGSLGKNWEEMLLKGFEECFRVLKNGGFLIFKWNETDIKVTEILKLTSEKPIFGHISGKRANTHWICFMKGGSQ